MSKTYKGYELMQAIADGKIKEGSKFKVSNNFSKIEYDGYTFRWENSKEIVWVDNFTDKNITFELIEDEIDIQSIEKYETRYTERCIDREVRNKINEILEAVKQLDKRIKQ